MTTRRQSHETIARPAPEQLPAIIESLLFVSEEPQEIGAISRSLNVPRQGVERAIESLAESSEGRGIFIQRNGDLVQLSTTPEAAPYIEHFLEVEHGRLSRASLETLAIIAYRQPATRAVIESVRGVNSDHAVATLLARGLIEDVGRAPSPGRPVLFGTSIRFLEYFGLQKPDDLPPLPELEPADDAAGERITVGTASEDGGAEETAAQANATAPADPDEADAPRDVDPEQAGTTADNAGRNLSTVER